MTPLSSRLATQPWNPKSDVSIFGSSFHMLGLTPPEQWTLVHNSGGQKIFTQKIINKNIFTEKENSVQVEMIVLPRAAARHFVVVVHNDHLRRKIRFLKKINKKLCNVLSCNLSGQRGYVCQVSVGTNRTGHCTAGDEGPIADISCMSIFSACFGLPTSVQLTATTWSGQIWISGLILPHFDVRTISVA